MRTAAVGVGVNLLAVRSVCAYITHIWAFGQPNSGLFRNGTMTTGQLLTQAREAAGLSREELAERVKISLRTLEKLEQGAIKQPKLVTVAAIAAVLGRTCADFVPTPSPPPPPRPVGRPPKSPTQDVPKRKRG